MDCDRSTSGTEPSIRNATPRKGERCASKRSTSQSWSSMARVPAVARPMPALLPGYCPLHQSSTLGRGGARASCPRALVSGGWWDSLPRVNVATPDGLPVLRFAEADEFDAWLDQHHDERGIW